MNISDGMTILDLACGTGDMIIQLRRKIKDVNIIGADFSKNMLDIARQKGVIDPL